ncbi:crosslink repair DNA glycosylase YcaQ family protein [uncultured Nocardioides sp.]|uniref:winged helix-turn-helix domain-containing protein n=1 Tax=uncultured Nocardioides sp. TaxID=198441 RepID=UPI002633F547|nr:crosslink repair DNA glycosylase YcaQ family protein [uncultured Nocardioides sp.]
MTPSLPGPAPERLTRTRARRVALAAQGFTDRPHATPSLRTLERTLRRTGVLQVDSVNVLARAHLMPVFSRVGPYDVDLVRRASEVRPRRMVEYWAHVQAFMPVDLWPAMRHRMAEHRRRHEADGPRWSPQVEADVLAEVAARGPVTARDLDDGAPRRTGHWGWNWSEARQVLDLLYRTGEVAIAGRNRQFEVLYDVPERVLPPDVLARPTPSVEEASRELVRRAAASHGVATLVCLRDYYRMSPAAAARAVEELVESGELLPARVEGWDRPAYLHHEARTPRRIGARALLSPFDPVVWERERTERLFGFRYRIEIYVPAAKRVHGYYVLPFLLGDRLVARVDLKADRATGRLLVHAAYAEAGTSAGEVADALADELADLADWLGLETVVVGERGDLAPALAAAVGRGGR